MFKKVLITLLTVSFLTVIASDLFAGPCVNVGVAKFCVNNATCSKWFGQPNKCTYHISGTASFVANNYTVRVTGYDQFNTALWTVQTNVTNGSGYWSMRIDTTCGAVKGRIRFIDQPGLEKPVQDSIDVDVVAEVYAPALTTYGLIALALLLAGTAVWMFRKRRVSVA